MLSILVGVGTVVLLVAGLIAYIRNNNEVGSRGSCGENCRDCGGCGISYEEVKAASQKHSPGK